MLFRSSIKFQTDTLPEKEYGNPISMTEKRISEGKTTEDCKLTESEMRSLAYTKGKIKVTDTVNGEIFTFKNTQDVGLIGMFSKKTISNAIKTGNPTRITKLSKYKNPCIIERILPIASPLSNIQL